MAQTTAILFAPDGREPPESVLAWLDARGLPVVTVSSADDLMGRCLRSRPRVAIFDIRVHPVASLRACRRLKSDSYTAIIPAVAIARGDVTGLGAAFDEGVDEVLSEHMDVGEAGHRLDALLRRNDRDTGVHPSTRLPGAVAIEAEIANRLASGERFGVCYADLDHFKEYNDRYSYYDGDRVIRILAKILHDVVKGLAGERGFIGHIGGDDFIFIIPLEAVPVVCREIIEVFDSLVPFQYSEQDRRATYFFGKDRRGQLHRVPLMTVSIGVVTNEHRHFTHAAQVSELATEMKSYAKTLPGSVFSIDRRHDSALAAAEPQHTDSLGVGERQ